MTTISMRQQAWLALSIAVNNKAAGSHVAPCSCMRAFIDETSLRRGKEASGPWAGPGVNELEGRGETRS